MFDIYSLTEQDGDIPALCETIATTQDEAWAAAIANSLTECFPGVAFSYIEKKENPFKNFSKKKKFNMFQH